MTNSPMRNLFPILSVVAGAACALFIGTIAGRSAAQPYLEVKNEFDELPAAEQKLILGKAESLQRKWETDPDDRRRLEAIHRAVSSDQDLDAKLRQFHQWWVELDSRQKSQLKEQGEFVDGWAEKAQELYLRTRFDADEIRVRFIEVKFSTRSFQAFLQSVIPEPPPAELKAGLDAFAGDGKECERILVQSLWIYGILTRSPSERPESSDLTADQLITFVESHLVSPEMRERYAQARNTFFKGAAPRPNDARTRVIVGAFLRSAIDHYDDIFKEKHLGDQRDNLVSVFVSLDRDRQSELLRRDPEHVQEILRRRLIEQRSAEEKDTAVAKLAEQLNDFSRYSRWRGFPSRQGFGRGDGRGKGDRGDRGGPDRHGGRNGSEGRPSPEGRPRDPQPD